MAQQLDCQVTCRRVQPRNPLSDVIAYCATHEWTSRPQPGFTSAHRSAGAHKRRMQRRDAR